MTGRRDEDRARAARSLYIRDQATAREIAAVLGVHERTIRRWLDQDGVDRRSPGPRRAAVPDAKIMTLRGLGQSWAEISRQTGLSPTGVRKRWAAAAGRAVP